VFGPLTTAAAMDRENAFGASKQFYYGLLILLYAVGLGNYCTLHIAHACSERKKGE
jgi:hypothetical protein